MEFITQWEARIILSHFIYCYCRDSERFFITVYEYAIDNFFKLEMCGKALLMARSAQQCRRLLTSSKTKPCYHLANVQRMHVVSVCLHYGNIIWLP